MNGFLFTDKLSDIDLDLNELSQLEAERQARRLIMIPSESIAPKAVRQLLGSPFVNLYAEGYPRAETRTQTQAEILDLPTQLGYYRRYGDLRYYKGVDYVNVVEALARRRLPNFLLPIRLPPKTYGSMCSPYLVPPPIMPSTQHSLNLAILSWA